VRLIEYQGTSVHLRLRGPANLELEVLLDERAFDRAPVAAGERTPVSWPRAEAHSLH
jgi:putative spermidine/putrescine transport system ATP-binding protein